ncbi:hypothetical protein [Methylobacterium gregans]
MVARIAAILRPHLEGKRPERIAQVAVEIADAVAPCGVTLQARQARLGQVGRTGELPDRIFALMMDGAPRTVAEICSVLATDGVTRKQVYNGLGYLIRRHEIERLGHARYQAQRQASGPVEAAA